MKTVPVSPAAIIGFTFMLTLPNNGINYKNIHYLTTKFNYYKYVLFTVELFNAQK